MDDTQRSTRTEPGEAESTLVSQLVVVLILQAQAIGPLASELVHPVVLRHLLLTPSLRQLLRLPRVVISEVSVPMLAEEAPVNSSGATFRIREVAKPEGFGSFYHPLPRAPDCEGPAKVYEDLATDSTEEARKIF